MKMPQKCKRRWVVRSLLIAIISVVLFHPKQLSAAALGSVTGFAKNGQTVTFTMQNGIMNLTVCSPRIIRVWCSGNTIFTAKDAYGANRTSWGTTAYTTEESTTEVRILTTSLIVAVSKTNGAISYRDLASTTVCAEQGATGKDLTPSTTYPNAPYSFTTNFLITSDESIYGMGQYPWADNKLDWKGRNSALYPARYTDDGDLLTIPVAISNKGYGIFWDNFLTTLAWQQTNTVMSVKADYSPYLDYYFLYGPEIDTIIKCYRDISGKVPMFGKWVMGYHQSKCQYNSQAEVLSIAKEFRTRKIPIDNIVTDWQWWTDWGSFQFKPAQWPNPTAMNDSLHNGLHCHSQLSIWTVFNPGNPNYTELYNAGCLQATGYPNGNALYNNTLIPKCDSIYWKQVASQIWTKKFDAIWNDATEGDMYASKDWRSPAYASMVCKTSYEGQRTITNDKRVYTLTRSAWAGQQRYAFALWSGDIQTSFATLRKQIPAGINYCMSGMPYWTTDIGGYWRQTDSITMIRWFEYGTFCPVFRVHGSADKEPWRYGATAEKILTDYIKLRYKLMPYIYSLAWKVTDEGYTMMRGLLMDFRNDVTARNSNNQFMFGPAFLINPVTDSLATTRQVYLPAGKWTDFWTGAPINGGVTISAPAPLQTIPIFARAGSIVPFGPDLQYATEKQADTIELRVYPGANGSFTLYEDENDNYNYEKGTYATIPFSWNDAAQTLTIGARQGTFPGMLTNRIFNVVIVANNHGIGQQKTTTIDAKVAYSGTPVSVNNGVVTTNNGIILAAQSIPWSLSVSGLTSSSITVRFTVPHESANKQVLIRIYNLQGGLVQTLFHGNPNAGRHSVGFTQNSQIQSGKYFCRIQGQGFDKTVNMMIMR